MVWFYPSSTFFPSSNSANFQSHYGLILSTEGARKDTVGGASFNPTMVWFYPQVNFTKTATDNLFQSHYGLILSLGSGTTALVALKLFQSHYGLILSNVR